MVVLVALLASGSEYAIPLAALIVSIAVTVYSVFGGGRWNKLTSFEEIQAERIKDLVGQLDKLREDNKDCARRCRDLERENLLMLRKLARIENGNHT